MELQSIRGFKQQRECIDAMIQTLESFEGADVTNRQQLMKLLITQSNQYAAQIQATSKTVTEDCARLAIETQRMQLEQKLNINLQEKPEDKVQWREV